MTRLAAVLTVAALAACQSADTGKATQDLEGPAVGECGKIETHGFGIYSAPGGEATIDIARPGEHVVIVSAHDATTWHITTEPGAKVVHVYAVGYDKQKVDISGAAGNADVRSDSMPTTGVWGCGYSWPYVAAAGDTCDTANMLKLASVRMGRQINSFDGCENASSFVLDDHMHAFSECSGNPDGSLPPNHFIADCDGGNEGKCGYGSGDPNGGGPGGGGGGSGGDGGGSGSGGPVEL